MRSNAAPRRAGTLWRWTLSSFLGLAMMASTLAVGVADREAEAQDILFFKHNVAAHKMDCAQCHVSSGAPKFTVKTAITNGGGPHGGPGISCDDSGCHVNKVKGTNIQWSGSGRTITNTFCFNCHAHRPKGFPNIRSRGNGSYVQGAFSHKVHVQRTSGDCKTCHAPVKNVLNSLEFDDKLQSKTIQRDMGLPGHKECATCHFKKIAPDLTKDCATCHAQAPEGVDRSKFLLNVNPDGTIRDDYRVGFAFKLAKKRMGRGQIQSSAWHKGHAKAYKKKTRSRTEIDCVQCHNNSETEVGQVVPMPTKAACETCHNDKGAFGVLGASCNRCHVAFDDRK